MIVTNGSQPDAIKVDVDKDRSILGPIYVSNLANIDTSSASRLFSSDGDLWYQDGTCASPLGSGCPVQPGDPHRAMARWSDVYDGGMERNRLGAPGAKPEPARLPATSSVCQVPRARRATRSCQVTTPTRRPIPDNATVYFQSGDHWLDDSGSGPTRTTST